VEVSIVAGCLSTTTQSMMGRAASVVATPAAAGITGVGDAAATSFSSKLRSMGALASSSAVGTGLPTLLAQMCSIATSANFSL